jgi:predicted ester cyclase
MKYLILLALTGLFFGGCTSGTDKANAENIALVNQYIKAVEDMDFEGMGQFLDEKYMGMGPSFGDTIYKKEAVENWKANVANLYKKIHYNRSRSAAVQIGDGDNKGDWVGNWAELTIDYQNGGTVTIWANTNYQVENGKIVKSFTFYNEADALRQLGYKIVAPASTQ